MKAFIIEHPGVYLPGYTIVFAEDAIAAWREAREMITRDHPEVQPLDELAPGGSTSGNARIYEVPMYGATMIWNGDY